MKKRKKAFLDLNEIKSTSRSLIIFLNLFRFISFSVALGKMASSKTKISLTKASSKDIDRGLKLRSLTRKQELEHKEMGEF